MNDNTRLTTDYSRLRFPIEQYRLTNGLRVLLHHDDTVPIVAVNIWYHVGSKDEDPSRTGLAHLFEHLMFEGSARHDGPYFRPLEEAGGLVNGSTGNDRTNYFEVVPSQFLELALFLEADRMAALLAALTIEKFETQRSVVKNERRQRIDNQPYGRAAEEIARRLYPPGHPYRWPVIGWMEHLDACTLDDCRRFFLGNYRPANASLAVVGSFEHDQARAWIDRYFGSVPGDEPVCRRAESWTPRLDAMIRANLEDAVALERIDLAWPTAPRFSADEPALDFAAEILGGRSKDSRLKRRLIHDDRLATSIGAYHSALKLTGQFGVRAYALADSSADRMETAIWEELDRLRREPPNPEEMQRARNEFLNDAFGRIETVLGKAEAFNHFVFYRGCVAEDSVLEEIERYSAVTAEEVRHAVERYLTDRCVVMAVTPSGNSPVPAQGTSFDIVAGAHRTGRGGMTATTRLPPVDTPRPFRLPVVDRARAANGLRVCVVHRPKIPIVEFLIVVGAGSAHDPIGQAGVARLTADTLDEGTIAMEGLEIARKLDRLGSRLTASIGADTATVALRVVRDATAEAFAILADVVTRPKFDPQDVARERKRLLAELAHKPKDPHALADDAIAAAVFGATHPYGRPCEGDPQSVASIGSVELRTFHESRYRPDHAALIAVGDITLDQVVGLVDAHLSTWGSIGRNDPPPTPMESCSWADRVVLIDREYAQQTVLRLGRRAIPRNHPDYFPLLVLNTVVGGSFVSRLNLELREAKGYTYGVRSELALGRNDGAVIIAADVASSSTSAAVRDMVEQLAAVSSLRPVRPDELEFSKSYLLRRFPARFETGRSVATLLAQLVAYDLPDDYYENYLETVQAVTLQQVKDAAERYAKPDAIKIVAVGRPDSIAELQQLTIQV
jgi:zinc protease